MYYLGQIKADFLGISVTLAVRLEAGKQPWRVKLLKIIHNFGANGLLIVL